VGQAQQKREYEGELKDYYGGSVELNLKLIELSPLAVWDVSQFPGRARDGVYISVDQYRVQAVTHRGTLEDETVVLTQWIPRSAVQDDRYDVALILVGELEELVRQKIDG
jgi:hypothetical protein